MAFIAILELVREGLIECSQTEPYAPLHVRSASAHRTLHLVADNSVVEPDANQTPVVEDAPGDEEPTS